MSLLFDVERLHMVLFDAVGTLIVPDPSGVDVYYQVGRQHGSTLERAQVHARFTQAVCRHFGPDAIGADPWSTDADRERARWQAIVADVFVELSGAPNRLFRELWDHFADPGNWRVDHEVEGTFQELRRLGVLIGLASNFDARLDAICDYWPALQLVDVVFHSAALGTRKPGRRFFERIQHQLHVPPHRLMMVGDDWEGDFRTPQGLGWHALHLDHHRPRADSEPEDRIGSLAELVTRLGLID